MQSVQSTALLLVLCTAVLYSAVLLSLHVQSAEGYSSTYNAKDFSRNVSQLIDRLLNEKHYDKRIRPGFGGETFICRTTELCRTTESGWGSPSMALDGAFILGY